MEEIKNLSIYLPQEVQVSLQLVSSFSGFDLGDFLVRSINRGFDIGELSISQK
jgi:hypothetical protein